MLEVKNIFKSYKPKKGPEVKALNGVSIKFPEKGLVFILGKSGSGKSTLLNVLGGLDVIDEGEIIIKGKSSKDFTQADFDSYRNTYLGFVFQEYNILEEFTVGKNIALALELQGKKATDEIIEEILKEVDLAGFSNRKLNELSGGQKQRVAIARALIKNPEIILADEPTGALDSKTGLQVFDTLKSLAKDKLVIVVSHDREFAEMYGDRVIELKDGKVISDIEKFKEKPDLTDSGLIKVDERILAFRKGHVLTKEDVETINEVLKESDTLISSDSTTNTEFKRIARIDENLNREIFKDTNEDSIAYKESGEFSLIKSSLPLRNSFKIGVSALKNKPIRLFFTILLSVCSFGLFGIADSMGSFDEATTVFNALKDKPNDNFQILQYEGIKDSDGEVSKKSRKFTKEDKTEFENKYGLKSEGILELYNSASFPYFDTEKLNFSDAGSCNFVYLSEDRLKELNFEIVSGHLPVEEYELVLTDFHFKNLKISGLNYYDEDDNPIILENNEIRFYNDLLGKRIRLGGEFYQICGFINTHTVDTENNKWEELYTTDNFGNNQSLNNLGREFECEVVDNYPNSLYISKAREDFYFQGGGFFNTSLNDKELRLELVGQQLPAYRNQFWQFTSLSNVNRDYYFIDSNKTTLNNAEVLLSESIKNDYLRIDESSYVDAGDKEHSMINFEFDSGTKTWQRKEVNKTFDLVGALRYEGLDYYVYDYALENLPTNNIFSAYVKEFYKFENNGDYQEYDGEITDEMHVYAYYTLIRNDSVLLEEKYSDEVKDFVTENHTFSTNGFGGKSFNVLSNEFEEYLLNKYGYHDDYRYTLNMSILEYAIGETESQQYKDLKVVGFFDDPFGDVSGGIVLPDQIYNQLKNMIPLTYTSLLTNVQHDNTLYSLAKENNFNGEGVSYYIRNAVTGSISNFVFIIEMLSNVFIWIGLTLAIFSGILLANFISTSITYKKKEIGILRAVGAKASDVFKIFFSEAFVIAMINLILACIAAGISIYFINDTFVSNLGTIGSFYFFSFRQFGIMLALAIGVAGLATFLPVYFLSRKKPVDSINNR